MIGLLRLHQGGLRGKELQSLQRLHRLQRKEQIDAVAPSAAALLLLIQVLMQQAAFAPAFPASNFSEQDGFPSSELSGTVRSRHDGSPYRSVATH